MVLGLIKAGHAAYKTAKAVKAASKVRKAAKAAKAAKSKKASKSTKPRRAKAEGKYATTRKDPYSKVKLERRESTGKSPRNTNEKTKETPRRSPRAGMGSVANKGRGGAKNPGVKKK